MINFLMKKKNKKKQILRLRTNAAEHLGLLFFCVWDCVHPGGLIFFFFLGTEGFATVNSSHLHQCFQYIHFPSAWSSAAPRSPEIRGCNLSPAFSSKFLLEEETQHNDYLIFI